MSNIAQNAEWLSGVVILFAYLWIFSVIRLKYQEYRNTKLKFKFFALRDRLALLVNQGELEENSIQFGALRDSINYSIASIDDLSIMHVARMLIDALQDESSSLSHSLFRTEHEEVQSISEAYLQLNRELLVKNSSTVFFSIFLRLLELIRLLGISAAAVKNTPRKAIMLIDNVASTKAA